MTARCQCVFSADVLTSTQACPFRARFNTRHTWTEPSWFSFRCCQCVVNTRGWASYQSSSFSTLPFLFLINKKFRIYSVMEKRQKLYEYYRRRRCCCCFLCCHKSRSKPQHGNNAAPLSASWLLKTEKLQIKGQRRRKRHQLLYVQFLFIADW